MNQIQIMLGPDDDGKPCLAVWHSTDESETVLWQTGAGDLLEAVRYAHSIAQAKGATFIPNVIIGVSL